MKVKIIMNSGKEYVEDFSDTEYQTFEDLANKLIVPGVHFLPRNGRNKAIKAEHISSIEEAR